MAASVKLWAMPILHPSAIIQGQRHKEPAQKRYLTRLKEWVDAGVTPDVINVNEPPPGSSLYPSPEDMDLFYEEAASPEWGAVSHDLENAGPHIICDGMTLLNTETGAVGRSVCLRFRVQGGDPYWATQKELHHVVYGLARHLADAEVAKVFHNGVTHDVPILEEIGFDVAGRLIDTMIMMHTAYSEMPKGLQFCATLWNGTPVWKTLVEEGEDEEGK